MPAKSPKNKGTVLPEAPLVLIHGDDDFAVSRRARQVYHGWCEAAGGMDHETLDAAAVNAGEAVTIPKEWMGIWDTDGYSKIWVIYSEDGSGL